MTTTSKQTKRTFYPPKSFDQDLLAFAQLAKDEGWHFSGVDLDQLARDAADQSAQRAQYDCAEAQFNAIREEFAHAQDTRYRRFTAALNAARSSFQSDEIVARKLEQFKRPSSRPPVTQRLRAGYRLERPAT